MSRVSSRRPVSLAAGCALAAAGIASGVTAVVTWSLLSSHIAVAERCVVEDAAAAADRAARSLEHLRREQRRAKRPAIDLVADHPFEPCD